MNDNVIDATSRFRKKEPIKEVTPEKNEVPLVQPKKRTHIRWLNMFPPGILTIMDKDLPEPFPPDPPPKQAA